jgi:hypothetical protein
MEDIVMSRVRLLLLSLLVLSAVGVATASSALAAHEWQKNGAALTQEEPALFEGKLFILTVAGKEIDCGTVSGTVDIFPGTKSLILDVHFLECVTSLPGCLVHSPGTPNGLILIGDLPAELVLAETHTGVKVLANEVKENPTTKEIVKLEFSADPGDNCTGFPATKVKGHIASEVRNAKEELNFPNPELKGNTLEAFGAAAELTGGVKQMLTNGGTLTGI